ncbi:MAG: hypothetical protein ACOH1N_00565 [Lutibacter sp.]
MPTKNKWLYPTDNFGKMEKGVVYESEHYISKTKAHKMNSEHPDKSSPI